MIVYQRMFLFAEMKNCFAEYAFVEMILIKR